MNNLIIEAIENKNVIQFYYESELRVVEPHCYGVTTAGNEGLRAFQTDGYSSSGKKGWKMYDLSKAENIEILSDTFISSRPGYKRGDRGMDEIFAEL
jgi:hypothetical protein